MTRIELLENNIKNIKEKVEKIREECNILEATNMKAFSNRTRIVEARAELVRFNEKLDEILKIELEANGQH